MEYCKDCMKFFEDDELKVVWGKTRTNPGGDELVCPDCGGSDLDEVDDSYLDGYSAGMAKAKVIVGWNEDA